MMNNFCILNPVFGTVMGYFLYHFISCMTPRAPNLSPCPKTFLMN